MLERVFGKGKIRKQPFSTVPQVHVFNHVHSSIVCHIQNMESTYILLDQGMVKENVIHLHNGELHSRKKNDILKLAGKWMDQEKIILNKVI